MVRCGSGRRLIEDKPDIATVPVGTVSQGQIYESLVGVEIWNKDLQEQSSSAAGWKRGERCLQCEVQFSCKPHETFSFLQFALGHRKQRNTVQYVMHL